MVTILVGPQQLGNVCVGGTVWLEGRGGAVLGEVTVKGAEPSHPVPPQPALERDR